MISFLDYIRHMATLPETSGIIFSGSATIASRFPKTGNSYYYYSCQDIEDMSQYGFFGFWKCLGDEEVVELEGVSGFYYKCNIYLPNMDEVVGYYYRYFRGSASQPRTMDKLEVNGTIYSTTDGNKYKQGATVVYQLQNKGVRYGLFKNDWDLFVNKPNCLYIIMDIGWEGTESNSKVNVYIDLENKKLVSNPQTAGGQIWYDLEDYYVPGTDGKQIFYPNSNGTMDMTRRVYIDTEDEDFTYFQQPNQNTLPFAILDNTMVIDTHKYPAPSLTIFDVPQKLIEKYGDNYIVFMFGNGIYDETGVLVPWDALGFIFYINTPVEKSQTVVIYHPSNRNWCEVFRTENVSSTITNISTSDLKSSTSNVELNFIDQSVIDLDIYKKMADIGNGLMLFDDETEDLKYLYDTKNKELYNEYCDLVGTNAITFKK